MDNRDRGIPPQNCLRVRVISTVTPSLSDGQRNIRGLSDPVGLSGRPKQGLSVPVALRGLGVPSLGLSDRVAGLSDRVAGLSDRVAGLSDRTSCLSDLSVTRTAVVNGGTKRFAVMMPAATRAPEGQDNLAKRTKRALGACSCTCCDHHTTDLSRNNINDKLYTDAVESVNRLKMKVEELRSFNTDLLGRIQTSQRKYAEAADLAEGTRRNLVHALSGKETAEEALRKAEDAKVALESNVGKLRNEVSNIQQLLSAQLACAKKKAIPKLSYASVLPRTRKARIESVMRLIRTEVVSRDANDDGRAESELQQILYDLFEANPQMKVGEMLRLSAASDVLFCEKFNISQNARSRMNHFLRTELIEKIVLFAKNAEVKALREKLSRKAEYSFAMRDLGNGGPPSACLWHNDIKEFISERVNALESSGKFLSDPDIYKGKLWTAINIDAGNSFTKVSLNIGNTVDANSVDNHSIIGVYAGDDCRQHLEKALPELIAQINDLSSCDGLTSNLLIERFLVGDMKMLCSVYGHNGASCRKPCLFCDSTNRVLISRQLSSRFTARTVQSYTDISQDSDAKKLEMSVCGPPLFNIPLTNVVPSSLHIVMGLTDLVMGAAEELCFSFDNATPHSMGEDRKAMRKTIRTQKALLEEKRSLKKGFGLLLGDCDTTCAVLLKYKNASLEPRGNYSGRCSSSYCVFVDKKSLEFTTTTDTERVKCSGCSQYTHLACENILGKELVDDINENDHFCCGCLRLSLDDRINSIERLKEDIVNDESNCDTVITACLQNISDCERALSGNTGQYYKNLQDVCKQLGADPSAWHQKWTGNQCYRLLHGDGPARIHAVFPSNTPQPDARVVALGKTLSLLGRIQSFTVAKFFNDSEIAEFEKTIQEFVDVLSILMPKRVATPKLHWLCHHVIPFVRLYRTWGYLSEQGIEASHARFNSFMRRYACMKRNVKSFLLCVAESFNLQNRTFDGTISVDS